MVAIDNGNVIELESLRWLKSRLQTLESHGGNLLEDWLSLERVDSPLLSERTRGAANIDKAIATLQTLKNASKCLDQLSKAIQDVTTSLQERILPNIFHHGLTSLPPEILERMSVLARDSDFHYIPQLQFICRRLRAFELNIPSLWTYASDMMPTERITLQLDRSGGLGMTFSIVSGGERPHDIPYECRCDQLKLIREHGDRWTSGIVALLDFEEDGSGHFCFEVLCPEPVAAVFPLLEELELELEDTDSYSIVTSWSMPRLRLVRAHTEDALLDIPPSSTPDTFIWNIENRPIFHNIVSNSLASFPASQLRRLELRWANYTFRDLSGGNQSFEPNLTMLEDLELTLHDDDSLRSMPGSPLFFLLTILRSARMPNIVNVSLICHWDIVQSDDFLPWVSSWKNPRLRRVTLHFFRFNPAEDPTAEEYSEETLKDRIRHELGIGETNADNGTGSCPLVNIVFSDERAT